MKQRTTYSKPQTLSDWRKYRLTDLFNYFDVPENERKVFRWVLDTESVMPDDANKIGTEWHILFTRFRRWYDGMKRNGTLQKTIQELEEKRAREARR